MYTNANSKASIRNETAKLVAEYLAKGGKITVVPTAVSFR